MRIELTLHAPDAEPCDIAVEAPAATPIARLRDAVEATGVAARGEFWIDDRILSPDATLGGSGLRTGLVVGVGGTVRVHGRATGTLDVIGGPCAGERIDLVGDRLTIGRAAGCDLALTGDPDVSRRHAVIDLAGTRVTVTDAGSTNGTSVDGVMVSGATSLGSDQVLRVGDTFARVSAAAVPPAVVRDVEGTRLVNRAPRQRAAGHEAEIVLPAAPATRAPQRVQLLSAALPALAGAGFAWALHAPQFLFFALLSPAVLVATSLGDRVHWRRSRRREAASYHLRMREARQRVRAALAAETAARRAAVPDPLTVLDAAAVPTLRLWERRRGDEDLLCVRLGLADLPSAVTVRDRGSVQPGGTCHAVPIVVDLRAGPLGVSGPPDAVAASGRWIIGQLCTLHSPADLDVVLLLGPGAECWAWARWLPHLRDRAATTAQACTEALAELSALVVNRRAARPGPGPWRGPWTVVVVDGRAVLPDAVAVTPVLEAADVGVTVVWLGGSTAALPGACARVAEVGGEAGTRVRLRGPGTVEGVLDQVPVRWADELARALAPLADGDGDATGLPGACPLSAVLDFALDDEDAVARKWAGSDGGAATAIGVAGDGLCVLDLVRDGPHALVAGTTGAGKSELLQTMIAGLAARYPPDELAFLLVDYKGGAAFGDCARLPHAAGLVTDLDAALTRRALQSLDAELTRREKLFADVGAADLSAYRARSGGAAALGRLVIVVDEFAALADELPEFVRGLVGVAQRGRSLGLHLVLATQRPGSAVSPEIRANANIRIALRVVDPADSMEVLDTADAALVDRRTPGRALLRVAGPPTAFQCAHAGARVRAAADSVRVLPLGPWRTPSGPADEVPGPSELERLVDLLRSVATRTGRARASSPWRDPLPDSLPVDGPLLANTGDDRESTVSPWIIPLGLVDLPDEQRQQTLTVDLGRGPSGLLVATGRSGRSTALATLAIQAARRLGPALLHVHAIDPSGGLAPLAALPHWGTYAGPDDLSCAATLVERLRAELDRRRQLLASWGHASAAESRAAGRAIPQTLLLVDGWESFCAASDERDAGRTSDALLALARTGPSAGLTVFATGDRGALSPRVSAAFGERWIGALADRMDYGMAGVAAHALPDDVPPGRVVRARDNALVQLGYVGADPTRAEQERAVAAIASTGGDDDNDDDGAGAGAASVLPVVRIRSLPSDVSLATLARPAGSIVLGLAGDGAQPVQIPLRPGTAFLIAGPPRSGRSTALLCMLAQLAPQGAQVVIAASARSPLAAAAVRAGLEVLGPDDALPALAGLAIERGADDPWAPVILLLDDLDRFEGARLADDVAHLLRTRPEDLAVVVTARTDEVATSYRGLAAALRRNRCGLLLQPGPVDGDVLGVQLPRHRAAAPPGRGVLVGDPAWGAAFITSAWIPVQVARP